MRALRAEQDISQEMLARLADLHRTHSGVIEPNERNASIDNIARPACAPGVDIHDPSTPVPSSGS